jgi:hypothetical protein
MVPHRIRRLLMLMAVAAVGLSARGAREAAGAVTLGFREDFTQAPLTSGWSSTQTTVTNPGTGGFGGAGDGFLSMVRSPTDGNLGAFSGDPVYVGNWTAAGITQVRLWLKDIGTSNPLEIHVSVGNGNNLWQYNTGFVPPSGVWGEFVVDLTSSAAFTHILNSVSGTYAQALAGADRLLVRHDLAPYTMAPDVTHGDFGLDHILLTNGLVGVEPTSRPVAQPVQLAPPSPNPSRGPVSLSITQPAAAGVHIEIVDAAGRRIRSVELPEAGAAPRLWVWDGLDDRGARVAPGVYRVRAFGPNGGMSRPLVRIE